MATVCEQTRALVGLTGYLGVCGVAMRNVGGCEVWNAAPADVKTRASLEALAALKAGCVTAVPEWRWRVLENQLRAGNAASVKGCESLIAGIAKTVAPVAAIAYGGVKIATAVRGVLQGKEEPPANTADSTINAGPPNPNVQKAGAFAAAGPIVLVIVALGILGALYARAKRGA